MGRASKAKFFSYSSEEGMSFYGTAVEARAAAQTCLDLVRECGEADGEWPDEAETILWGEVKEAALDVSCSLAYVDYNLVELEDT